MRKDKVKALRQGLMSQESIYSKVSQNDEVPLKASYTVSKILLKKVKPYKDGELVKERLEKVAKIAFPEKASIISKISLNRMTVARRGCDMASDIELSLRDKIANFQYFSLAMDGSTDNTDTAQLAIFVRGKLT